MKPKLTAAEIAERFGVTPTNSEYTAWRCLSCGDTYKRSYVLVRKRGGCPSCMKKARAKRTAQRSREYAKTSLAEVMDELRLKFGGRISLVKSSYVNRDSHASFRCACGNKWKAIVKSALTMKYGCKVCASAETARKMAEALYAKAKRRLNAEGFTTVGDPSDVRNYIRVTCRRCGSTTRTRLLVLNRRKSCRVCWHGRTPFHKTEVEIDGRQFMLAGYEELAIRWLLVRGKTKLHRIETENLPAFLYEEHGKTRSYHPDFLVGNKVVEVKSTWTLGLGDARILNNVKRKAKAVQREGRSFVLMLMRGDGERLSIPKNWISLKRLALVEELSRLNPECEEIRRYAERHLG